MSTLQQHGLWLLAVRGPANKELQCEKGQDGAFTAHLTVAPQSTLFASISIASSHISLILSDTAAYRMTNKCFAFPMLQNLNMSRQ